MQRDREWRVAMQDLIERSHATIARTRELSAMADRTLRLTYVAQGRRQMRQSEQQVLRELAERHALADSSADS